MDDLLHTPHPDHRGAQRALVAHLSRRSSRRCRSFLHVDRSQFVPDLDLVMLAGYVSHKDQTEAISAYRDALNA